MNCPYGRLINRFLYADRFVYVGLRALTQPTVECKIHLIMLGCVP
jgi:hypothetical protein